MKVTITINIPSKTYADGYYEWSTWEKGQDHDIAILVPKWCEYLGGPRLDPLQWVEYVGIALPERRLVDGEAQEWRERQQARASRARAGALEALRDFRNNMDATEENP